MLTRPAPAGDAVDAHVAARIRSLRKLLGLSLHELAAKLGISQQQLLKYERAANRISASRLYTIAAVLCVPVGYFFDDMREKRLDAFEDARHRDDITIHAEEARNLVQAYYRVPGFGHRRKILEFVKALGGD